VNTIIFSKDRACQLDALLRSIREQVDGWWQRGSWSVVFTASDDPFRRGYARLRGDPVAQGFEFIDEERRGAGFREIVIGAMEAQLRQNPAAFCMFLVDDDVFKSPWHPVDAGPMDVLARDQSVACVSLRMCRRYDRSYNLGIDTRPPPMDAGCRWKWRRAKGDWGYPMSLDGHVFRYADLLPIVKRIDFRSPNTLEAALAKHPLVRRPRMVCYPEAIVVNLPLNIVQTEWVNRVAEMHGVAAAWLNREYLAGRRIDLAPIYALRTNRACHHEMPIRWTPAPARVEASSAAAGPVRG
jgi:hypothetical protein